MNLKYAAKSIFAVLAFSMIFTLVGCKEKKAGFSTEHKMESRSDVTDEVEAKITYPVFTDEKLSALNGLIEAKVGKFDGIVKEYKDMHEEFSQSFPPTEDFPTPQFYYEESMEVKSSGKYISVLDTISDYAGGAHGNHWYESICFDTEKNQNVDIFEVTGKTQEEIAKYCKDEIIRTVYQVEDEEDVFPWLEGALNLSVFTVENGKTTVYFAPYEVAAYAYGPVLIELE